MNSKTVSQLIKENRSLISDLLETHYEVSSELSQNLNAPAPYRNEALQNLYKRGGRGAVWELAETITIEFAQKYESHQWDGEYFDFLEEFIESKLQELGLNN